MNQTLLDKLELMEEDHGDIVSIAYEKINPYSDSAWCLVNKVIYDFENLIADNNTCIGLMDEIFLEYHLLIQQMPIILYNFKKLGLTHLGEKVNAMMYDSLRVRSHNWYEYNSGRSEIDWWNPYSSEPQALILYIQKMCRWYGFEYTPVK